MQRPMHNAQAPATRVIYVQQNAPYAQPAYLVPQTVFIQQPQQPVQVSQPLETRPEAQPLVVTDSLWQQIQECSNIGGSTELKAKYDEVQSVHAQSQKLLQDDIVKLLNSESFLDSRIRTRLSSKWTMTQSSVLQQEYREQIQLSFDRLRSAAEVNQKTEHSVRVSESKFVVFEMERAAIEQNEQGTFRDSQELEQICATFEGLYSRLLERLEFYNDLSAEYILPLKQQVPAYCVSRETERDAMLKELGHSFQSLGIDPTVEPRSVVCNTQPAPPQQQRIVMMRPAAVAAPLVLYLQSAAPVVSARSSPVSMSAASNLDTAKSAENAENEEDAAVDGKKKKSRCTLFDVEDIRPLIDMEFSSMKSVLKQGLLIKCFLALFVLSLVGIVFDIALAVKVSRREGCVYEVFKADDELKRYDRYVVLLWFSTATAIVNTLVFKFGYAFYIKRKHHISFWSAMKYVTIHTYLSTSVKYSACCNRHHWLRIIISFSEDFLQFMIATRIKEALRTFDFLTEFSVWKSLFTIIGIWTNAVLWFGVDWQRGQVKQSILSLWHRCRNTSDNFEKIDIPPIKTRKFKMLKYGGVCCFFVFFITNGLYAVSTAFLNWTVGWNDFQVADIVVHIEEMNIILHDPQMQRYEISVSNFTFDVHFGVNDGPELGLLGLKSVIGLLDLSSFDWVHCFDAAQNELHTNLDYDQAEFPTVCLCVFGNAFIISMNPLSTSDNDDDEDPLQWSVTPLMKSEWSTGVDYEVIGFEGWKSGTVKGSSSCTGNACGKDEYVLDENSFIRLQCRQDFVFRCES